MAHSNDAVCSIPTTLVIISSDFSGTCSQALKAAIIWLRMSLPGLPYRYS